MRDSPIEPALDETAVRTMRQAASPCAAAALAIGMALLAGWCLGSETLKAFLPGHVTAKPNAALAIVASAVALFFTRAGRAWLVRLGQALLVLVGLVGAATALEYITARDLGIDQWLFVEPPGAVETAQPGRMALMTAVEFVLLAVTSLWCAPGKCTGRCRAQWVATLGFVVGAVALLGYTFGDDALYGFGSGTRMSLPVALALSLLFLAVLLGRAEAGWVARMAGRHAGGAMLRRAVPFAVVAPWLIGWMSVWGSQAGLYSYGADQVLTVGSLIILSVLFLCSARKPWTNSIGRSRHAGRRWRC